MSNKGLPVKGYTDQSDSKVALVNENKVLEERVLRQLDEMTNSGLYDPRWIATARTDIEKGFMAMNRAVFRPERISLPNG